MKTLYAGLLVLGGLLGGTAAADEDMMNTQPQGTNIQQEKHGADQVRENGDGADPKMKQEIQDDWREDAEQRRKSDVMKPEQRG